jgi:hypothetical protein
MYTCSKCGAVLNPDGVCPNCGTAHNIQQAAPPQAAPVQQAAPPQAAPPQAAPPQAAPPQGTFPQQAAPAQQGTASGGNPLDKFFAVNSEDDADMVFGEKRFKVSLIIAVLSGLCVIFYFLPFLTASAKFFGMSVKMSVSPRVFGATANALGVSASAGLGGFGNFLVFFLFLIPLLICGLAVGLAFFSDKVKPKLRFLENKLFLCLTAGAGGGLLFLILFLATYSEEGYSVGPGIGWVLSFLLYLLIGAVSFMCMQKTKTK